VCVVCYLTSRRWTIFHNQIKCKLESPAHAGDFFVDIMEAIHVRDLMDSVRKVKTISEDMTFDSFKTFFCEYHQHHFPMVDKQNRLVKICSINDVRGQFFAAKSDNNVHMGSFGTDQIITTSPSDDLNSVLHKFTIKNIDSLPVVQDDDNTILIGMLNRREVIGFYNKKVREMKAATTV
jgi:CIC family chloride channel protein